MNKSIKTFTKLILFYISWIIISVVIPIPDTLPDVWWRFLAELIPFLSIILITYIFNRHEENHLNIMHYGRPAKQTIIGILLALAWFLIPFLSFMD